MIAISASISLINVCGTETLSKSSLIGSGSSGSIPESE